MARSLAVRIDSIPTRGRFVIARGAKRHVDVVVAEVRDGPHTGRGEATAIYYRGESAEGVADALRAAEPFVRDGGGREQLLAVMPPGAARNALDCALWDLEAKKSARPVWSLLGQDAPGPIVTAFTISLDEPAAMADAASQARAYSLLKLKLGGEGDIERVEAVRRAVPEARLIADANEAWAGHDIEALAARLAALGVEFVEQPVPAGRDAMLDGLRCALPFCADETLHDRSDLERIAGRYRLINVKLDKCGGLTEALALSADARRRGIDVLTGCMLSTSLGVAPAFYAARTGSYADLDGPLLLARDREHAMRFDGSLMHPPAPRLWG